MWHLMGDPRNNSLLVWPSNKCQVLRVRTTGVMALRLRIVESAEQERRVEWPACHEHSNNKFLHYTATKQAGLNPHASSLSSGPNVGGGSLLSLMLYM